MQRKKRVYFYISLILAFLIPGTSLAAPVAASKPLSKPQIAAPAAILIDAKSGNILYSKNAEQKRSIASTTKIMTGILAVENISPADTITASKRAAAVGESEIYLSEGEVMNAENMMYALMLRSANDGAVAIAEKISGSVENFSVLMNKKAKELNMKSTNFTNPHGLSNGTHYSTAKDMSKLAKYAMKNEKFRQIVSTKKKSIPWPGKPYQRMAENYNKLIGSYSEATGVKTGYTNSAGYCLVSSAKRGDREVIAVVLGARSSDDAAKQSRSLLEWGLSLKNKILVNKNKIYANLRVSDNEVIPLIAKSPKRALVPEGTTYKTFVVADKSIEPPIEKGQTVGKLEIVSDSGESLGSVPLMAKEGSKVSLFEQFMGFLGGVFSSFTGLIGK